MITGASIIVVVLAVSVLAYRPDWAIAIALAIAPFSVLYRQVELPLGLNLAELAVAAAGVGLVSRWVSGQVAFRGTQMDLPILFYLAATSWAILISDQPLFELIGYGLLCVGQVVGFYVAANVAREPLVLRRLVVVTLLSSTIAALACTVMFFLPVTHDIVVSGNGRLGGFFESPTAAGQLYAVVLPFAFALLFSDRQEWTTRLFLLVALASGFGFLVLGEARSAFGGALVGCAAAAVCHGRKSLKGLVTSTLAALPILVYLGVSGKLGQWVLLLVGLDRFKERKLIYPFVIDFVLTHPLGAGIGALRLSSQEVLGTAWSAHNIFLGFAGEAGWFGLLVLSIFAIVHVLSPLSVRHATGASRVVLCGLFGSNLAFWVNAMFHSQIHWYLLWLVWGLGFAAQRWISNQTTMTLVDADEGGAATRTKDSPK